MNIKFKVNFFIKIFILIFALCSSLYIYSNSSMSFGYENYYLVPLLYGILVFLLPKINFTSFTSPGRFIFLMTTIVKYLLLPLISCYGHYYSWLGKYPGSDNIAFAVILNLIELFFGLIFLNYLSSKNSASNSNNVVDILPMKNSFLFYIFVFFAILIIFAIPETIADQRFILNQTNLTENIVIDFPFSGIFKTIFIFGRYAIILLIINYFYKKNLIKKSKINIFMSFLPVLLNCLFISNLSRITIFVPLITFSSVILYLYSSISERKLIIKILLFSLIISISFLSIVKFFGEGRGNENNSNNIAWWGDTINMYFSGVKETAVGVNSLEYVNSFYGKNKINLFLDDVFSNVIGLSNFTNSSRNSTRLYNTVYFGSNIANCQIVPNIIEGLYYFGKYFCYIWILFFIWLCDFFDNLAKKAKYIEIKFALLYASVYCGMVLMLNSAIIIANIINVSLLFLIVSYFNKLIKLSR